MAQQQKNEAKELEARKAELDTREKALAERAEKLDRREQSFEEREKALAERELNVRTQEKAVLQAADQVKSQAEDLKRQAAELQARASVPEGAEVEVPHVVGGIVAVRSGGELQAFRVPDEIGSLGVPGCPPILVPRSRVLRTNVARLIEHLKRSRAEPLTEEAADELENQAAADAAGEEPEGGAVEGQAAGA